MNNFPISINTKDAKYAARAWRTEVLQRQADDEVVAILQSFVPEGFTVRVHECDEPVPGFPYAPNYKFSGMLHDANRDGSDAHFFVNAYTREGINAKLLAHILDRRSFFPLT